MHRTLRFLLPVGLGALSAFTFVLGAEPFEVPGQNSPGEWLGGSVALAAYYAVCQFWFARRDARSGTSSWSAVTAMLFGLVAAGLVVMAAEGREQWRFFVAPALLAALVGTAVGIAVGRRAGTPRGASFARGK